MATTTNFGWETPDDTDLVKDGAAAIRTLGQSIDTSMSQLEGGTTGQILSKTSATDMAFTWINNDQGDITGVTAGTGISGGGTSGAVTVTNSMATAITTAGDLIKGTGSGTFDRLGIGSTGQVLTVTAGAPAWETASSGSFTSIATGSLSGSTTTISTIASTYRDLRLVIATPQLSNASVLMTVNGVTSVYKETDNYLSDTSMTTSSMEICSATTGQSGNIIVVEIYEYALALTKLIQAKSNATASTNRTIGTRRWFGNTSSAVSSITVSTGSGSFSGGTYTLYGVK